MVNPDEVKQVIVIRKDLGMRKGKIASQAAHASMAAILKHADIRGMTCSIEMTEEIEQWLSGIFTKICVCVNSEEELLSVYNKAEDAGLSCALIKDAGLTEFGGVPTYTAVAVGPNKNVDVDKLTGHLKLL